MAAENLAIEMRALSRDVIINVEDEDDVDRPEDFDAHDDLAGSYMQLIENEEDGSNRKSITASIRESVRSTVSRVSRTKSKCSRYLKPVKSILFKLKLLLLITIYSVFGAWLFMHFEVPADLEAKTKAYETRFVARDNLLINLRAIYQENRENREEKWKEAILAFEKKLELDEPEIETVWTFWMSFLYAGTIFTTIGYGNIACSTTGGQVATVLYAIVGIPIMIAILNDLGDVLLVIVRSFTNSMSDILLYTAVRCGLQKIDSNVERRKRFVQFARRLAKYGIGEATSLSTLATQDTLEQLEDDEDEVKRDPPVVQALVATIGWIMFASAVFCLWEDWSYWTSVYFFFISTSTIGLGDVTPAHPEYMMATFMIVIVGLSLVNVCINVVCEKIELMYLALLNKMAEDYQKAVESGDPRAMEGMMSGFKGRAKFLMPLISKNAGNKVMNQFKQEAKAKGIDIPPVLTNLDPQTGMPAFAKAEKGDFRDYIEIAEAKKAEEDRIEQMFNEQRSRKPSSVMRPQMVTTAVVTEEFMPPKAQMCEASCQAWSLEEIFAERRPACFVEVQTHPQCVDEHSHYGQVELDYDSVEIQTDSPDMLEHGIQVVPEYFDAATEYDSSVIIGVEAQTQAINYENHGCQCEPSTSGLVDTSTQPEVSMLYHEYDDEDEDMDESTTSQSVISSISELSLYEEADTEDEEILQEEMQLQMEAPGLLPLSVFLKLLRSGADESGS